MSGKGWGGKTNQGNLTLQFKNTAANPNNSISDTTAEPFLNTMPPIAGSNANANGALAQFEDLSSLTPSSLLLEEELG